MLSTLRLIAITLTLVALACGRSSAPNVLLLVLDTTRADAIAAYREGPAYTPTVDALAAEGILFTQARSTSAWTVPSHGSLFTGLYPSRHGAHAESELLPAEAVTLAELLRPTHETVGFSENPHIIRAKGYAQGFDEYEETYRRRPSPGEPPVTLELIEAWLAERDHGRPFFLFVNLMTPHLPYRPPPRLRARFMPAGVSDASARRFAAVGERQARLFMSGALHFQPPDLEILRALYRADVSYADERTAQLLGQLRAHDALERTLVVVIGDHGENIGDHGLMEHQLCLYESLLRVPMLFRLPGVFEAGRRSDAPVQLVDVAPTVLETVGLPRTSWPVMEGQSLLHGAPAPDRPVVAEYMRPLEQRKLFRRVNPDFEFGVFDRRLKSIQVGRWRLIVSDRGEAELYDLTSDPDESRNLAAEQPQRVAALEQRLHDWAGSSPTRSPLDPPALDEETRESLRSLGYLE